MPTQTVLILGGTREAAALARRLQAEQPDWRIIVSLAGRTRAPAGMAGEIRVGGFGGATGLADYLRAERVTRLIDATHPYAVTISRHAMIAAGEAGIPLEVRRREAWTRRPGDRWIDVATIGAACNAIPAGARVFLALGRQHIAPFVARADVFFLIRSVDPLDPPFPGCRTIAGRPGTEDEEAELLTRHAITHVVSRNSGGEGAYGKIAAARRLGLPVIMIARPADAASAAATGG